MFKAIVTGACGMDGSYLSEFLLEKDYQVIGVTRRKSVDPGIDNVKHLIDHPNFKLIYGDILDSTLIYRLLADHKPHEFYNLAAQSHVGQSFKEPTATWRINAEAVITQLEAINQVSPYTRYYQAGTSELWGGINCPIEGYSEKSNFNPRSPYAIAKLAAFWAVKNYRESYDLYVCNGVLGNHSSIRRGRDFATRKITHGVASVKLGLQDKLRMGNLDPFRDEGASPDYVRAMWMMLQQEQPDDYVIATGEGATIKEMLEYVCELAQLKIEDVYQQDPQFMRPSDVPYLKGDASKARDKLGWSPTYDWKRLLKEMYEHDFSQLSK